MSKTPLSRFVQISTSCLVVAGFLGFAPLVSADEAVTPTAQDTQLVQNDVEALSAALLAEVRADLNDRLPTEIALAIDPAMQADTLQADAR